MPAIELYTRAIELTPNNAVLYSNRAFAHIKTEAFGYFIFSSLPLSSISSPLLIPSKPHLFYRSALIDAQKAIDLDKKYIKGYYRMATAKLALNKHKEALSYFRQVLPSLSIKEDKKEEN